MQRRNFLSIFPVGLLSFFGKNEAKAVVIPEPEVKKEEIVYGKFKGATYGIQNGIVVFREKRGERHYYDENGTIRYITDINTGYFIYYDENGFCHREDGPAQGWPGHWEIWSIHGKRHRIGGPADINYETHEYAYWENDKYLYTAINHTPEIFPGNSMTTIFPTTDSKGFGQTGRYELRDSNGKLQRRGNFDFCVAAKPANAEGFKLKFVPVTSGPNDLVTHILTALYSRCHMKNKDLLTQKIRPDIDSYPI